MSDMLEGLFGEAEGMPSEAPMEAPMDPMMQQKKAMGGFDLPIPGQSLTAPKGEMSFEQPPQFTDVEDAITHLYEKVFAQQNVNNFLRIINTGVPIEMLIEPILLHGAQEGLWNVDMSLMLYEPLVGMLVGMAESAGVKVNFRPEENNDIDIRPFEKIAKGADVGAKQKETPDFEAAQARKDELLKSLKPKGLLAKGDKQ